MPLDNSNLNDPIARYLIYGEEPAAAKKPLDPVASFLLHGTEEEQKAEREKQARIQKAADENLQKRGEFTRGVARGTDILQGSLYGFAGLAGSGLGLEGVKQWGFEGYKRNLEEAQENPATVQFENLSLTEPMKAARWAIGMLGELAPSMAEAAVSSLAGAAIGTAAAPGPGTAVGALGGFLGKRALRKMIESAAQSYVKKGVAREAAEEFAEKEVADMAENALVKAGMRTAAAQTGMVAGVMPMEAGGNWGETLREQGIDNPITALATGTAAAFLELAGGNARQLGKFLGPAKEAALHKAISAGDTHLVARMAKEALTSGPGEYAQEFSQEFLSLVNTALNDPTFEIYTTENLKRLNEAGWSGFVGGGAGGVLGGAKSASDEATAAREKAKLYGTLADNAKLTEPILTWKKEGKSTEEIYRNVAGVIDEFNALLQEKSRRDVPMSAVSEMVDGVLARDLEAGKPKRKPGVLGALGMREKAGSTGITTGGQAVTDIGKTPAPTAGAPGMEMPGTAAPTAGAPPKTAAGIPKSKAATAPPSPMGAPTTAVDELGEGREVPEERTKIKLERDLLAPITPAGTARPAPAPTAGAPRAIPRPAETPQAAAVGPAAAAETPAAPPDAADVFRRMPEDALRQQADLGVAGARDELARRAAEAQAATPKVSPVPSTSPPSSTAQPSRATAPAREGPTSAETAKEPDLPEAKSAAVKTSYAERMKNAATADEGRKLISDYTEEFASIEREAGLKHTVGVGGSGFGLRGYSTLSPAEKKKIVAAVTKKNPVLGERLKALIRDIDASEPHWEALHKKEMVGFRAPKPAATQGVATMGARPKSAADKVAVEKPSAKPREPGRFKFTSEVEAKKWAKDNGVSGKLQKLGNELYQLDFEQTDKKITAPGGWYLNTKNEPIYLTQDSKETEWHRGPYVWDYVQPEEGGTEKDIIGKQLQSDNEELRRTAALHPKAPARKPPKPAATGRMSDYGLQAVKTTTKKGTPVWNIFGNTKEHSQTIKRIGGRWYGPKKAWSFYDGDPTAKLLEALGGKKTATKQGVTTLGAKEKPAEAQEPKPGAPFKKGDKVIVTWNGKKIPATVFTSNADNTAVYPDAEDKALGIDQNMPLTVDNSFVETASRKTGTLLQPGDRVQTKDGKKIGTVVPTKDVLKRQGITLIRYDGEDYDASPLTEYLVKIEKTAEAPQEQYKSIGKNSEGQEIYEDTNGIRSIVENGVRITESVAMIPTRAGLKKEPKTPRSAEFEVAAGREEAGRLTSFDTPEIIAAREKARKIPETIYIDTPERTALRERLANEFYGEGSKNKNRRLDLVIGPPGSGKSSRLAEPLAVEHGSLLIDADEVKKKLPEYDNGIGAHATHKESALIADELILGKAITSGDNIVWARLGKTLKTMQDLITDLKEQGYEIHIHYMDTTPEEAARRAVTRFQETGRFVDPYYILNTVDTNPKKVYDQIKQMEEVSSYEAYNNNVPKGEVPRLLETVVHRATEPAGGERLQRPGGTQHAPATEQGKEAAEPEVTPPIYGSKNKLVTDAELKEAEAILREALSGLHMGPPLSPQAIQAGIKIAVYHIEAGSRAFVDYAAKMISTFGDVIRPYLKQLYMAAKYQPGLDTTGMDTEADLAAIETGIVTLEDKQTLMGMLQRNDRVYYKKKYEARPSAGYFREYKDGYIRVVSGGGLTTEVFPDDIIRAERDGKPIDIAEKEDILEPTEGGEEGDQRDQREQPRPGVAGPSGLDAGESPATNVRPVPEGEAAGLPGQEGRPGEYPLGEAGAGEETAELAGPGDRISRPDLPARRPGEPGERPSAAVRGEAESDRELAEQPHGTERGRNHRIGPDDPLVPRGKVARIEANVRAIILSKKLQKENREATPAERRILAQYTGWGAVTEEMFKDDYERAVRYEREGSYFWNVMDPKEKEAYLKWKKRVGEKLYPGLDGILTEEEWSAARESGLNAHFTSRDVIERGLWALARRLGFESGTVLEPAAGVGHILGLIPEEISGRVRLMGVELDNVTGNILKQLYPDAEVQVTGFEDARGLADNTADLVISNFPFGKYEIFDKQHPDYSGWSIHNYFFARSLDAVRPGGLVVAITSHWTMDATTNGAVRKYLAEKADLIGAIRLPNTAFKENAGTEVVTDIVVLRKKTGEILPGTEEWRLVMPEKTKKGKEVSINEYFIRHPEMILGKNSTEGSMYGEDEYTVLPDPAAPLAEQLDAAVARFPERLIGQAAPQAVRNEQEAALADQAQKEGQLVLSEKGIFRVENGRLVKPAWSKDAKRVKQARAYLKVKEQTKRTEEAMLDPGATDEEIAAEQAALNRIYDAYVKAHGPITSARNGHLADDIEFAHAMALEREVRVAKIGKITKGPRAGQEHPYWVKRYEKMDIFTKRTLYPFVEPESAASMEDALNISLTYRNHLNLDLIAKLLGKTDADSVRREILDQKLAFENPASGLLEMPGEYLSGNVREKLRIAEEKGYAANAEALRQVQPKDLTIDEIYFRLGSQWIPADTIKNFLVDLGYYPYSTKVEFSKTAIGEDTRSSWSVNADWIDLPEWDTPRVKAFELVNDTLNLKMTTVYDTFRDDNNIERKVISEEQTAAAQDKQRQLNDAFINWILRTPDAAKNLTDIYNREKNNYVDRDWTVPEMKHYPGASATILLDDHQKRGVARGLQGSCIYAHAVGTGKTFLYISLAMELRRTGQARKPLIIVQNATLNQFAAQARQLYPAARILCPTKADRQQKNRQRLLSQIATGDWDFVILPHSFFDGISVRPDRERAFLQEQIDTIKELLLAENAGRRGRGSKSLKVKQLEAMLKQKEARMRALLNQRQDTHMALEDMGIDAMLVDEAHHYKRGEFFTQMGNIKGIDRGSAAKSFRFLMKCRVIQEKTGFKNIYLATGTPVSNTTAELWTLLRYIRPDLLEAFNVSSFDAFATSFGDTSYELEPTPTGEYERVARFNKYVNGPEMLRMWKAAADVILQEEVPRWKGAVPKLRGGKIQETVLPRSDMLAQFVMAVRSAREAWEQLPGDEKRDLTHVPLMLYNWAKSAAIDMRLVVNGVPDTAVSKVNRCVKEVYDRWSEYADNRGTQLVFCDTFNGPGGFNLYEDIRKKLIAKGIPEKEIAIITESRYSSDDAREALFEQVNEGAVRVVLGSSFKLGTGVNVQERLVAIHHIDAPVRPMDFEQRNGRIIRPGNGNQEVEILAYATKNSLDSLAYSVLQKKQKFVNQLLRGDLPGRMFDDPADELQFAFEDLAAAAMDNPLFKLRYDLEGQLRELTLLRAAYRENIGKIRSKIWSAENYIKHFQGQAEKLARIADETKQAFPDAKITQIEIDGKEMDLQEGEKALKALMDERRAEVEKALEDYLEEAKKDKTPSRIRGHKTHYEDVVTVLWHLRNSTSDLAKARDDVQYQKIIERFEAIGRQIQFRVNGRDVRMRIDPDYKKETAEDLSETVVPAVSLVTVAEIGGGVSTRKRSVSGILTDLEKEIESAIRGPETNQDAIEHEQRSLEANQAELDKPFPREEELRDVQDQLSATIRELEATAAESAEGLDDETQNRIEAWADMMVRGARPVMRAKYTHRPAKLERRVNIGPMAGVPDAAAAAAALTAPVAPDLDELRTKVSEKWEGYIDETEFEDDDEREAYAEWRAVQARAQAILAANGEGKIEDAQKGLDKARRVWSLMDHEEGEEENFPPIFDTVQRIITAVRQGQGKLFPGDQYSAETGGKPAARAGRPEFDDLVSGLTTTAKGIRARKTEDGRWVVRTKGGDAVEIVSVEQITPDEIEIEILERDWGVKYDTAAMKGRRIAGAYTPETKRIRLVKNVAGAYTITHEFEHFLEDIGAITNADILLLKQKINSLHKSGKLGFKPALADRVGGPEDRAKWIARQLTGGYDAKTPIGRILQKIREIIDRIVNALGARTAAGVVRDIRGGQIFGREEAEAPPGGISEAAAESYSQEGLPEDTAGRISDFSVEMPEETQAQRAAAGTAAAARPQEAAAGPSGPIGSAAEALWQATFGSAAGAANRAVVSLGARRAAPETGRGWERFKQSWKEFWAPFSTVPEGKQALAARYKAMGDVAQAVRFLEGLHQQLDAYPPEIKKDMFRYLDGQIPLETLPEDARPLAESIRSRTHQIGEALVERGILAEGQFRKYEGRYIHYLYARHILGDKADIGLTGTGKLDLSYTMRRNPNLTMEQRRELGLIEDASVAVPIGMGKALTDIAKWDYLAAIAENPEWVWQPSVVKVAVGKPLKRPVRGRTRAYVKMGIGKLAEETALYAEMARKHPSPEVEEHYRILRAALDEAESLTANVPSDFKKLPNDKHYGDLAGAFVRAPIADDLRPILSLSTDKGRLFNTMVEIHGQAMAIFKIGKVAVNFPTAFRNIISNIIQNNMRGRPLVKIFGDIVSALQSMKAGDAIYEEAYRSGMFKTNWFAAEINDVLDQFKKAADKDAPWTRALSAIKNVAKYYGKIDDVSKFAIYKQMRTDGADHAEALLEAMKWGMDYSLTSRSVKGFRQTVTPFLSYQYKIAPLIAESLAKRPWVIGKYLAVWPLMKALAMGMNDLDDDDWDDLMKQLPSYVKQTGSVMILPWKSDKGQWQWINLEYFFPWGNYLGIFRDLRDREIGELTRDAGISNPFMDIYRIAQSARGDDPPEHPYTGQPIWNRLDSAPVKAGKFTEALANIWMPAMLTRQGAIGYAGKALTGGEDRWGREVTAGQALARWFGLNITAVSPEQTAAQASVKIQDLKKELSRIQADQSYDEEEKAEREARMRERIAEIGREAPAAVLPILKAKGADPVYEELLSMVEAGTLRSGPPARTVEIGGIPHRMTMEQYREYLALSSAAARPRLQKLFESTAWKTMNGQRRAKAVSSIVAHARKGARQKIKAEIARETRGKAGANRAELRP